MIVRTSKEMGLLTTGRMRRRLAQDHPTPKLPIIVSHDDSLSATISRADRAIERCAQATREDRERFHQLLHNADDRNLKAYVLLSFVSID
jgi:hypothetical protein